MSTTSLALFNPAGAAPTTSLVYHLAWMYSELGLRVLAADFNPQATLSARFLDEDRLSDLWLQNHANATVYDCIQPVLEERGDVAEPHVEPIEDNLGLIVGDLELLRLEEEFLTQWQRCPDGNEHAFRLISAFWRVHRLAAIEYEADVVLLDVGTNLGGLNRAALMAANNVVIPLFPDLFSLQGLRNVEPVFHDWRPQWKKLIEANANLDRELPPGEMNPIGYIVAKLPLRTDRPVTAYERWIGRIPALYMKSVLNQPSADVPAMIDDPHCLSVLKPYRSLAPLAREARKPIFLLKPADGALGAHAKAVQSAYQDFKELALKIAPKALMDLTSLITLKSYSEQ